MEDVLIQIGLPVSCLNKSCDTKSFVKPWSDYGGWYKSKLLRNRAKKWFCPIHSQEARKSEERFLSGGYSRNTPIKVEAQELTAEEELYKLLD